MLGALRLLFGIIVDLIVVAFFPQANWPIYELLFCHPPQIYWSAK